MIQRFFIHLLYKGLAILGYIFIVMLMPFVIIFIIVSKLYEALKDISVMYYQITIKLLKFIPVPLKPDVKFNTITLKKIKEAITWSW